MFKIPKQIDGLLPAAAVEKILDALQQPDLAGTVRETLSKVGVKDLQPIDRMQEAWQQTRIWLESLSSGGRQTESASGNLLNATGQLFRSEFAGLPMASVVAYGYAKSAMHFQQAGDALPRLQTALASSLGRSHAACIRGPAAALQLLRQQLGTSGWVVSRTDLIRIPELGDCATLLRNSGAEIIEVGASNGSQLSDWQEAIRDRHQTVFLVSPNGLTSAESLAQRKVAIAAAGEKQAQVVELLVDGVCNQHLSEKGGFPHVQASFAAGVSVVLLPMQYLMCGPDTTLVITLDESALEVHRAGERAGMSCRGAELAAAAIALQVASLSDEVEASAIAGLMANPDNLRDRARRLAIQLNGLDSIAEAKAIERELPLGPSPWDRYRLKSWAVELTPKADLSAIERLLSTGNPAFRVVGQPSEGSYLLDLRFVPPSSDHEIVRAARGNASADSDTE